ncbi:sulfite oxidase-like protein [Pseudovirgaria hyperparasitica]|uniref:Sulfite oxidase-like protein n=1 Tax=Pseudovirgaria hyperparasitica TaxID=470096 RepID=A0A6A6VVM5_9PEZI|nr:sulfite oxidase-like protein [Pseudovirgaria hyperparasitica]KAF2754738.1 sulfite oxidase-like protein [Pseudovirgaria hyperparasitica]
MSDLQTEYSVDEPLNREPPLKDLVSSFLTTKNGYDRNHGPIPHLDASKHIVQVDGAVKRQLSLSVDDLKTLTQHEVVCALQCAGNRRHTMRTQIKEVQGVDWYDGAVMNCKWEGPLLKDVLVHAGIDIEESRWKETHVAFACFQVKVQEDDWYGGSIPLDRAMRADAEVVLALKMNAEVLKPNHGFPVRVVVPGVAGARSVKWLDRITVQATESKNFYQQHDYKILPPHIDSAQAAENMWANVPALEEMPVNSVIAVPQPGSITELGSDGCIEVSGYALPSGESGPVVKVEVTADEGIHWVEAELLSDDEHKGKWAWTLWKTRISMEKGKSQRLFSRATDNAGNVQESMTMWNLRGVCYNGYGETRDLAIV